MLDKHKEKLEDLYSKSDILFLVELKQLDYRQYLKANDLKILDFLIFLNNDLEIGYGIASPYEGIYYDLKNTFIENNMHLKTLELD